MSEIEEIESYSRSSHYGLYLSICKKHFRKFLISLEKVEELETKKSKAENDSKEYLQFEYEIYKHNDIILDSGVIVIVFAAMCLEAFINEYGAARLSDNYFKKYLDRMDFVSKWVNIPKIVTSKSISLDSQGFELLNMLNSSRNKLVHFKSSEFCIDKVSPSDIAENKKNFRESVKDAFKAIFQITDELRKIDPKFTILVVFNLNEDESDLKKYT